jgi:hypothetical protein
VDLEELSRLSARDRWIYVVGRIAVESVNLDGRLRALLAALKGQSGRDALLEAAPAWSQTAADCRKHLGGRALDDRAHAAITVILDGADRAWDERNRYVHDRLVETMQANFDSAPPELVREGARLRVRLARDRKRVAPDEELVSLDQAVALVLELVALTWQLRVVENHLGGATAWNGLLFGHDTGCWDGSAEWISGDDDGDD